MKKFLASIVSLLVFLSLTQVASAQLNIPIGNDFAKVVFQAKDIASILGALITLIFIVAVVIALFFLAWGAIRWILSGGDKAAVESARGTIVAAVVGLVVLFLAFLLINVLLQFFNVNIGDIEVPTINT
jgi:hypothetical protein